MIKQTYCPLCDGKIKHKHLKPLDCSKNNKGLSEGTHIWICPECSFVGMEFINNTDVDTLARYLKR